MGGSTRAARPGGLAPRHAAYGPGAALARRLRRVARMFTGIVAELGAVVALERGDGAARLTVSGPSVVTGAAHGDSISVNGVCLTVTATSGSAFTADVMGETLRRSGIGSLMPGSPVNLERPIRAGDPLGGHLVQGHVDGIGRIVSRRSAQHSQVLRITLPNGLARYVVEKGSVAVDGVSLTVSACGDAATWNGCWTGGSDDDHRWHTRRGRHPAR